MKRGYQRPRLGKQAQHNMPWTVFKESVYTCLKLIGLNSVQQWRTGHKRQVQGRAHVDAGRELTLENQRWYF